MIRFFKWSWDLFNKVSVILLPLADIIGRVYVSYQFFIAGLNKFNAWSTTLTLFRHEHPVPFISPEFAAYSATGIELVVPVLLTLGLFGRLPGFILFIFNLVAVIAYSHFLFGPLGEFGLLQHIYWGITLFLLFTHGPSKWSLDYLWFRRKRS